MKEILVNKEIIFTGSELFQPRMKVEKEKLEMHFPDFIFYGTGNKVTSIKGPLTTNFNNTYEVRISILDSYPYEIPIVKLIGHQIEGDCEHLYYAGNICIMRSENWSSTYSLAFVVARTALWLNKYDLWRRNGKERWPGRDDHRFYKYINV